MTLAEKGIDDWIPRHVNLFKGEQSEPSYIKLNPKAQVPTLVHENRIIRESSVICDYLDDIFPNPPLKPEDPFRRPRLREWVKEADEAGFQGIATLSYITVFRNLILKMDLNERKQLWSKQTDISRTLRQRSCIQEGLQSPYAVIALASWERIFSDLEKSLNDHRKWIIGDTFSLADLNFAPFIARLEAINYLSLWLDTRPKTSAWWARLKARSSYIQAGVGPAPDEEKIFSEEGRKSVTEVRHVLNNLLLKGSI